MHIDCIADSNTEWNDIYLKRPFPFVFFLGLEVQYSDIDIKITIDTRYIGNEARYVRKSCTPNCEIRNYRTGHHINFVLVSLREIEPEEELTIPFDFPWRKAQFEFDCFCKRGEDCEVKKRKSMIDKPDYLK